MVESSKRLPTLEDLRSYVAEPSAASKPSTPTSIRFRKSFCIAPARHAAFSSACVARGQFN